MATADEYGTTPITVTPVEVTTTRTYEGKLNMFTENDHPLTIEIPAPTPGLYRYRLVIERERDAD